MTATLFDETGRRRWTTTSMLYVTIPENWTAIEGVFDETYYSVGDVATLRPAFPATIDKAAIALTGTDAATISGIPTNTAAKIFFNGSVKFDGLITDGAVVITSTMPGVFRVSMSLFPYLDKEVLINAA